MGKVIELIEDSLVSGIIFSPSITILSDKIYFKIFGFLWIWFFGMLIINNHSDCKNKLKHLKGEN